jgi:hypothetical protein
MYVSRRSLLRSGLAVPLMAEPARAQGLLLLGVGGGASGGPVGPPILMTFATFDGTPSAGVVMSNGNRTVTHGTTNNGAGNASSLTLSTGKYNFEIAASGGISNGNGCGIRPFAGGVFSEPVGSFASGIGVQLGTVNTFIFNNGASTGKNLGITADGDVFGFAIDLTARLGWVRRNGGTYNADAAANPATGANGIALVAGALSPMCRFTNAGATNAFTGNFGQAAFAFPAPSGFSLGWGM